MAEPWSAVPEWMAKAEGDWEALDILLSRFGETASAPFDPALIPRSGTAVPAYPSPRRGCKASAADQTVIVRMTADPEPMDTLVSWQSKRSVMEPHSQAVKPARSKAFELQRRMGGIDLEQGEVLVGEFLNSWW